MDAPVADSIVAVGYADLEMISLLLLFVIVIIVAKDHHILSLIFDNPRVIGNYGGTGHIVSCKMRF
jgi:ABC-type Mn2+/Zn2+ transport system permease subunit